MKGKLRVCSNLLKDTPYVIDSPRKVDFQLGPPNYQ